MKETYSGKSLMYKDSYLQIKNQKLKLPLYKHHKQIDI